MSIRIWQSNARELFAQRLSHRAASIAETARERWAQLLDRYPVYPEIDLGLLRDAAREWGEASKPTAAAIH